MNTKRTLITMAAAMAVAATVQGSSHREAPLITSTPKLDCTDFYMFSSYEAGREGYVTLVADYVPLQDAYGGPNYFQLDPAAVYEIHVDNSGDAVEDITFQFRFSNTPRGFALPVGPEGNRKTNSVPVLAVGQITAADNSALLVDQTYTLDIVRGARRSGTATPVVNPKTGTPVFTKPQDNVGLKTFPDYEAYARSYIYEITLPGTDKKGKVFVGQRKDPFVVNLGETFDLINISTSPLGPENANNDSLADKNVTALILEIPREFLGATAEKPILGGWSTASRVQGDTLVQVSRLGMPLVNEVVIGVKDKDKFNASEPKDDLANFADYVTHPTLPAIIELLYGSAGAVAPKVFPRGDLVAAFVTGVDGLNKNGSVGEMVRLNTAIAPVPAEKQNNLGVIAGISKGVLDAAKADLAGFPNGRRPGDDVVDIELRVAMGKLLSPDVAPAGDAPFTDGASVNASHFDNRFPYLRPPLGGSPNTSITISIEAGKTVDGNRTPVKASFDDTTRRLSAPVPADGTGFLKIRSDRAIGLEETRLEGGNISSKVK